MTDVAAIERQLAVHGLILRGGFDFDRQETAPPGLSGKTARAVLLVGNSGGAFWPHFDAWRAEQPANLADPLDTWSRLVIGAVAEAIGIRAVSPSDRPFLPFQQWAMRAEGLRPSPLGILMHPDFGLWHAYRGALLFEHSLGLPAAPATEHLCDSCATQPCRKACPVHAHDGVEFQYSECLGFLRSSSSDHCMRGGCLDRNACPYGLAYRYPLPTQAFLMAAFTR